MKGKLKRTLIVLAIAAGIVFVPYYVGVLFYPKSMLYGVLDTWLNGVLPLIIITFSGLVIFALGLIAYYYITTD